MEPTTYSFAPLTTYTSALQPRSSLNSVVTSVGKQLDLDYGSLLTQYYWLAGDIKSPVTTYSGVNNRLIESWAWNNSPIPRWNDYYLRILQYESFYGIKSSEMYELYKSGNLKHVPKEVVEDWVRLHRLFFF